MVKKCVTKIKTFECIQWTGLNYDEIYNFCDGKVTWKDKFYGLLILYCADNQVVDINDFILKNEENSVTNYYLYTKDRFYELFEIV